MLKKQGKKKSGKSGKRKLSLRLCPKCGKHLITRINPSSRQKFLGCTDFPHCKYTEPIKQNTIVDYVCMNLGLSWRPEIDNDVLLILENSDLFHSSDEKEYLLGAAYYIDQYKGESGCRHLSLHKTTIEYRGKDFTGIGFAEPWDAWGGSGPSALAFVPQFKFGERLHHDFGVFYSHEHAAVWEDSYKQSWQFQFAVEVDVHPYL